METPEYLAESFDYKSGEIALGFETCSAPTQVFWPEWVAWLVNPAKLLCRNALDTGRQSPDNRDASKIWSVNAEHEYFSQRRLQYIKELAVV
jgi:hypothetical protein